MNTTGISRKIFVVLNTIFLILLALISIYPLLYCCMISFSNANLVMANEAFVWKPLGFSLAAYKEILRNPTIGGGYLNTIFVVVVGTGINVFLSVIAAYFLSRKDIPITKPIMVLIVFTMYFNGGMVPTFLIVKGVGLYNSLWALIIPGAISAYNLIVMRTAFVEVPESLEESAMLDGAGAWMILFKILLPLVKASVAVITLYYAVAHWNDWFNGMIYLKDSDKFPLQLVLRKMLIVNTGDMIDDTGAGGEERIAETIQHATIMVATVPILCIYPFIQKYFEKGVMLGAVKG